MKSFLYFLLLVALNNMASGWKAEQDVTSKNLDKYDKRVRPSNDNGDAVKVDIGIYLTKFVHVDEATGDVDLSLYLGMQWNDPRLSWDDKKVKKISLPSASIWTPDLAFMTGDAAVEHVFNANEKYGVVVQPSGDVYFTHPLTQKINCVHTSKFFGLSCTFTITSWTYDRDGIVLKAANSSSAIDTSLLRSYYDPKYTIKEAKFEIKDVVYPDVPTAWQTLKGWIQLAKK